MSFLLESASFMSGAAVATVAFGSRYIVAKVRANSVSTKRDELIEKFRPMYAELEQKIEEADGRMASFALEYAAAYPALQKEPKGSATFKSYRGQAREKLNTMLKNLNALDAKNLSAKLVNKLASLLEENAESTEFKLLDLNYQLQNSENRLRQTIETMEELEAEAPVIAERMVKARAACDDAMARFDRLFVESIPPALFKAEKACESFQTELSELSVKVATKGESAPGKSYVPSFGEAVQALDSLDRLLKKVLSFTDTARADAAKMRGTLRNANKNIYGKTTPQRDIDYDAALVSLMEAEAQPYDKGNPRVEFDTIIRPYNTFIDNAREGLYRVNK